MSEAKNGFEKASTGHATSPVIVKMTDGTNADNKGRDAWGRDVSQWIQREPGDKLRPHP